MNWEGWNILKNLNHLIAFLSFGMGLLLPFFSEKWAFHFFEKILFVAFFLTFGFIFILFAQQYGKSRTKLKKAKKKYFYLANIISFILLLLIFFSFSHHLDENGIRRTNTIQEKGVVYKIDPEGYRKIRTVYYTFEHKGKMYNGRKVNPRHSFKIGDSVMVRFPQSSPEKNTLLVQNN